MGHRGELLAHVTSHPLGGRSRRDQLRVFRLQLAKLSHQRVEGGVGNLWLVQGVVEVGVVLYLAPQRLGPPARLFQPLFISCKQLFLIAHVNPGLSRIAVAKKGARFPRPRKLP